jgi:HK97 family phage major capsid protein
MSALIYVSNELLQDRAAISGLLMQKLYSALGYFEDIDVLRGTLGAVTTPIVGSLATVAVTFAGTAPTAAEIASMYFAMTPEGRARAQWFLSNVQYGALLGLNSTIAGTGTTVALASNRPIFQPSYVTGVSDMLLGRPVNTVQAAAISGASTFGFHDLSEYAVIKRAEASLDLNTSVAFTTNQTAVRLTIRFGGAPMQYSKVALEDGSVVASLVTRN